MQSISSIKQTVSEKKIFKDFFFFKNLPFLGPQQPILGPQEPIKISDQDKGHLKHSAFYSINISLKIKFKYLQ